MLKMIDEEVSNKWVGVMEEKYLRLLIDSRIPENLKVVIRALLKLRDEEKIVHKCDHILTTITNSNATS